MKLVQTIVLVFLILFGPSVMAEGQPVGKIIFATGGASLQSESGTLVKGQTGTPVYVGQTLSTGGGSHMHVQMMDGGLLVLRPSSSIRIAIYTVDLANPANTQILLDMKKGVVRSVTGKGGQTNKQGFRFNTPVAAIGIKGTDFTVLATANLASITLREGGVAVSPFSPLCPRYAVGACSGSQTVMLTAADQQMLAEVRAATAVRIPKVRAEVVPDNVAPAHPAEEKSVKDAKDSPVTSTVTSSATPAATTSTAQAGNGTSTQVASSTTQQATTQTGTATPTSSTAASTANATAAAASAGSTTLVKNNNTPASAAVPTAGGSAESASATSGVASGTSSTNTSDNVKIAPVASSDALSSGTGTTTTKDTGLSGSTAEVASLSPVTAEVGPKDSVTSELASRIVAEKTLGSTVDDVVNPAPVTPATPEQPVAAKSQPFYWGRWAGYAENPEQVIVRDPAKNKQIFAANQVYLLADGQAGSPQLPKSGTVTFNLDKGEAGIVKDGSLVPATISAASLQANFDNNRFKTGVTVNSDALKDGSVALVAEGGLLPSAGTFRNDTALSTMNVSGAFSEGAEQAAYAFDDPDNNIVGVTSWQR